MAEASDSRPTPLFFFGAMSPYSWFAAERIDELIPAADWRPVFAGGLFKACGRTSWGLTGERENKIADCEARARTHGLGSINWPDPWPTSDLLVARAMIYADRRGCLRRFALAAMRSAFIAGQDLGELSVVQQVGEQVGIDPVAMAAAVADRDIKSALRAATEEALELRVVGVPTVVVGRELYWGDDRLEAASRLR